MEALVGLMALGIPLTIWILFGVWGSAIMRGKGRSAGAGWAFGLILGLIGILVCVTLSDQRQQKHDAIWGRPRRRL